MPIYEYVCDECNERFEKIVINKQAEISCPKCASKKATIQLSVFATAGSGTSSSVEMCASKPRPATAIANVFWWSTPQASTHL